MSRSRQCDLPLTAGWGGKRKGAGRKPVGDQPLVSHGRRSDHSAAHPVHVTLRTVDELRCLRHHSMLPVLQNAIERAQRDTFTITAFSVQQNHLHLLVEADDREQLIRGIHGMVVRLAIAINRALKRHGKVWHDRYHSRALRTPRETRNALVYVLLNFRKHLRAGAGIDPASSGGWFDGWSRPPPAPARPSPVRPPRTWLLRTGWRRHGLISPSEMPASLA